MRVTNCKTSSKIIVVTYYKSALSIDNYKIVIVTDYKSATSSKIIVVTDYKSALKKDNYKIVIVTDYKSATSRSVSVGELFLKRKGFLLFCHVLKKVYTFYINTKIRLQFK